MNKTTIRYVTKLIVAKTTTIEVHPGHKITYKPGRVLETIKDEVGHFHPWKYVITLGHGMTETIPVENVKVKWYIETKKVITTNKEVKVK